MKGKWSQQSGSITGPKKKGSWKSSMGKIAGFLGTGENAKHAIVYLVIKYAFISGVVASIIVCANNWFFRDSDNQVPNITSDIRIVWEILTPIITLALGYLFGKKEN